MSFPFAIWGWAIDPAAATGTGIDDVGIWAVPHDGSAAWYLGNANYGIERRDVGGYFGDSRFDPSGFSFDINSLAPGNYTLWFFAHSTVADSWNNSFPYVATKQ